MRSKQIYKSRIHYVDPITGQVIITKTGAGKFSRLPRCVGKTLEIVDKLKGLGCSVIAWEIWDTEKKAVCMSRIYKTEEERTTPLTKMQNNDIIMEP